MEAQHILNSFTELDAIDTILYQDRLRVRDLERKEYKTEENEDKRKAEIALLKAEIE